MGAKWVSYQSLMYRWGLVFMCATACLALLMDEGSSKRSWDWMIAERERREAEKKRIQ